MALILVEVQDYRIKKQNSKMYYTFTEPYKFFRRGFLQGLFLLLLFLLHISKILLHILYKKQK